MVDWPICLLVLLTSPSPQNLDRLIAQLGSEVYAERKLATEILDALGAPALEPLRRACRTTGDAELRHRAERLVAIIQDRVLEGQFRAILASDSSPEEKGWKLSELIKPGMDIAQVRRLLGPPSAQFRPRRRPVGTLRYQRYQLTIVYDAVGIVTEVFGPARPSRPRNDFILPAGPEQPRDRIGRADRVTATSALS
jgi:hypothetical protein